VEKVVVKISQGSVVTQTMLGGLTIYPPVANFLWCICAKNYENWLAVDKVVAIIMRLTDHSCLCVMMMMITFFGPRCTVQHSW